MAADGVTTTGHQPTDEVVRGAGHTVSVPTSTTKDRRRAGAGWVAAALVVGFLLQVAWRLWLARGVPTPIAHADEDRYLLAARALAGGPGGFGNDTAVFRRLGYPLLLTPIYWFSSDPSTVYKSAQLLGALLNALTFPLAYALSRRLLGCEPRLALALGFGVATLPAVAYYGEFALTDAIFPPIGLAWLLLLHLSVSGGSARTRAWAAIGAAAVVGYAYAVHIRGAVLVLVHVTAVVTLTASRRTRWFLAVAALVTAAALSQINTLASAVIGERLVRGRGDPGSLVSQRLTSGQGVVHTLADGAGQIWYSGVATWGLAAVGLIAAVTRVRGRDLATRDWAQRFVFVIALSATVLVAMSSAAALPMDGRVNNHAYPRYIAFMMPVWVTLGVVELLRSDRRRAMRLVGSSAILLLAGGFLVLARTTTLYEEWFEPFDAPELSFLANDWTSLNVGQGSATALVILALLAWSATRRTHTGWWCLAAVFVLNITAMEVINSRAVYPRAAAEYATAPLLVDDLKVGPTDVVATARRVKLGPRLNHQREVTWAPIAGFDDLKGDPPPGATVVIAPWNVSYDEGAEGPGDWPGEELGWRRVAGDPVKQWAVWFRESDSRLDGVVSTGKGR